MKIEDFLDGKASWPELEQLYQDEQLRQSLFPCVRQGIFLAHAGVAPLSGAAAAAIKRYVERAASGFHQQDYDRETTLCREIAAQLCGVHPDEVALLGPTSLGLSLVALGLDWKPGDEVVIHAQDYPANVYVWRQLANRGVVLRELVPTQPGHIDLSVLSKKLESGRVRLVALASAHFLSGQVLDVEAVGRLCKQAGALFCLDGIQTLGAVQTPLHTVDFCAADSHKWLLGPLGAGIFIVKKERQELLRPALVGAENVLTQRFLPAEKITWVRGAARYEPGALNLLGIVGMRASMQMLLAWGVHNIESRLSALKRLAWMHLKEYGCQFLGQMPQQQPGAILTFRHESIPSSQLHAALVRRGFITSLRWTADGTEWIRISPHVCNRFEDIEHFCACCGTLIHQHR